MLFTGHLACFSPSVSYTVRLLWVRNGGKLTHTESDFRAAGFFFCDSMDDPWLSELLSRSLIVRHASWVTRCVFEDFCMPIAAYTLDDGFDESRILILDPSVLMIASRDYRDAPSKANEALDPSSRKRPFDSEGDSELQARKRPKKKPRMELPSNVPAVKKGNETYPIISNVSKDIPGRKYSKSVQDSQLSLGQVSFPSNEPRHRGKISKAIKLFESCISYPKSVPTPKKKEILPSPLTPHAVFWNELFAKYYPRDRTATLNLSVHDLLRAPPTKAAIFDVNESYLGRRFINADYI